MANGGVKHKPQLVIATQDATTRVRTPVPPEPAQSLGFKPENVDIVRNAMVAVTAILLLTFLCQHTVRDLNYAAMGKVPTDVLFELIGFEVPYLLALLLPLGLYVGIILAYGRLYSDNEMAILHMPTHLNVGLYEQ